MKISKMRPGLAATTVMFGIATLALGSSPAVAKGGGGQSSVIYNSTVSPLKGNMVSQAFEATSTSEFGDGITFASGTNRQLTNVVVTMSSWGCVTGSWHTSDCVTPAGDTFNEEITLNIYDPEELAVPIAHATQTFAIPYRPSASPRCTGDPTQGGHAGKWWDPSLKACFNGMATNVTFSFSGITVPDAIVYGIAYNTTHYGSDPIEDSSGCPAGGCGYDSLNVALSEVAPTVGTDVSTADAYLDSTWGGAYCDGGTSTGSFRLDAGCWSSSTPPYPYYYTPAVQFKAGRN
jgi:hypothetical protein